MADAAPVAAGTAAPAEPGSPRDEAAPAAAPGSSADDARAGSCSSGGDEPGRPRQEVMDAVQKQIEFYFSDANLPTDKHLLKQIQKDPEGWVPLRMLAGFKRVKALTRELGLVADALAGSEALDLDRAGERVRRRGALPAFDVADIARRTVVVEHLPPKPTIESVTALLAAYGAVAMVRICTPGNTSKLPAWLAKAVEAIAQTMAPGEFALAEYGSEDDCVACVAKTRNPDNWRTSLRVRHLLPGFKPTQPAKQDKHSRPSSRAGQEHGHRDGSAGGSASGSDAGGKHAGAAQRASHDGHGGHAHDHDHGAAAAAAAAGPSGLPVRLAPIRTHQPGSARANGGAPGQPGSPASPARGTGVGGAIGSPRSVQSPAPPEVTSFIDSILAAPTANTPTRDGRGGGGAGSGAGAARWSHADGAGSSGGGALTPAAAVAAALAGVCSPPQSSSPRHSATGGGGVRSSLTGGAAGVPGTPTRLSAATGGSAGSSGAGLAPTQGALAAQLAAAAAAAAQAAMAGSPRAAAGSGASHWRSSSGAAGPAGASVSAPTTPLAGLSAGDAVVAALDACSPVARRGAAASPELSSSPKPAPWVPASRALHMQAAAHEQGGLRSSGSEAEDNGGWRSSWSGGPSSLPGAGVHRPPKPRASGSGGDERQRRRSWHSDDAADSVAAALAGLAVHHECASTSDDGSSRAAGGARRSRLGQQGDYRSTIEAIREASCELDSVVAARAAAAAATAAPAPARRRSSATGGGDAEHAQEGDDEGGWEQRSRRRRSGTGSRRTSLDEGAAGAARRLSLDEGHGGRSRPSSRAGALSPEPERGGHGRPHSGGHHHGSPAPASHVAAAASAAAASAAGHEGARDIPKKKEKRDYASWAAATPEFRAAAAAANAAGGGSGGGAGAPGTSPGRAAAAGLSPLRASAGGGGGGAAAAAQHGDTHIARMPDGSRGFGVGRGRPLAPPPAASPAARPRRRASAPSARPPPRAAPRADRPHTRCRGRPEAAPREAGSAAMAAAAQRTGGRTTTPARAPPEREESPDLHEEVERLSKVFADAIDKYTAPRSMVQVQLAKLKEETRCPMCFGYIREARISMVCLHRYCAKCIEQYLRAKVPGRHGDDKECPVCRAHLHSRRATKPDHAFDKIIKALYGDVDAYDAEEEALIARDNRAHVAAWQAQLAHMKARQAAAVAAARAESGEPDWDAPRAADARRAPSERLRSAHSGAGGGGEPLTGSKRGWGDGGAWPSGGMDDSFYRSDVGAKRGPARPHGLAPPGAPAPPPPHYASAAPPPLQLQPSGAAGAGGAGGVGSPAAPAGSKKKRKLLAKEMAARLLGIAARAAAAAGPRPAACLVHLLPAAGGEQQGEQQHAPDVQGAQDTQDAQGAQDAQPAVDQPFLTCPMELTVGSVKQLLLQQLRQQGVCGGPQAPDVQLQLAAPPSGAAAPPSAPAGALADGVTLGQLYAGWWGAGPELRLQYRLAQAHAGSAG
ncbi:LARP6B [Scenedesmus sp. PABB004]|nr:LARP6B [Scenedesmus sp. PABB004]